MGNLLDEADQATLGARSESESHAIELRKSFTVGAFVFPLAGAML